MARWSPTPQQPARGTASPRNLPTTPQSAQRTKHTSDRRTSRLESPDRHQRPQRQHMVGHNHHRPPRTSPRHQTLGRRTPQTPNPSEAVTRHAPGQPPARALRRDVPAPSPPDMRCAPSASLSFSACRDMVSVPRSERVGSRAAVRRISRYGAAPDTVSVDHAVRPLAQRPRRWGD